MKRAFDVVVSALGIAVLWPLLLLAAAAVRIEGGGPVLFLQERVGRRFRPFRIFKFRTMVEGAPRLGPGITIGADRRVTRVGAILRKTKIDELPQLFNVLFGDMSFVGPRPELRRYVDLYPDDYREVLEVRPGITDIASIVYRDESGILGRVPDPEQHYVQVLLPDKIRLAKEYVRHASLGYDLRLIFTTLLCLVYPRRVAEHLSERLGRPHAALPLLVLAGFLAGSFTSG